MADLCDGCFNKYRMAVLKILVYNQNIIKDGYLEDLITLIHNSWVEVKE